MLTADEQRVLDALLPCRRVGCDGAIPLVSLRFARALIEYRLRTDSAFMLPGTCPECAAECAFTYSDVINRIPSHLRPAALPADRFWALMLIAGPEIASGESGFVGDRALIERVQDFGDAWTGYLRSVSAFTPTLPAGAIVCGKRFGTFPVCTGFQGATAIERLPLVCPTKADSATFYATPDAPDDLKLAQPMCSNPSCPHFFGMNYSQFCALLDSQRDIEWFWGGIPHVVLDCQRCGTSTVIDKETYATLFHL